MAKKIVKKATAKKGVTKAKSKKAPAKKSAPKKVSKKDLSEKEIQQKQANLIINSEKKKKARKGKRILGKKQSGTLLEAVIEGMQEKKARNIMVMDLRKLENRITDYFVISDAESKTHVGSIADGVEEFVYKKTGEKPYHSEGEQNNEWILIDYVDVVAHVFQIEFRHHYNIEGLWGDAEIKHIE